MSTKLNSIQGGAQVQRASSVEAAASLEKAQQPTPAPTDEFALSGSRAIQSAERAEAFQKPDWSSAKAETDRYGDRVLAYQVGRGDTLTSIAKRLGSDTETLQWANAIDDPNRIQAGQKLSLPTTFHIVQQGETYSAIAKRSRVSPAALMKLNGARSDALYVGQELKVPAAILTPEAAQTRRALQALMADGAKAVSDSYYGQPVVTAWANGNSIGWGDGGEYFIRDYSDDYSAAKDVDEEEGPNGPVIHHFSSPVEDTKRTITMQLIRGLTYEYHQKQGGEGSGVNPPEEPVEQGDGRVRYTVYDKANAPISILYDPINQCLLGPVERDGHVWIGRAAKPTEAMADLGKFLGLQFPLYARGPE